MDLCICKKCLCVKQSQLKPNQTKHQSNSTKFILNLGPILWAKTNFCCVLDCIRANFLKMFKEVDFSKWSVGKRWWSVKFTVQLVKMVCFWKNSTNLNVTWALHSLSQSPRHTLAYLIPCLTEIIFLWYYMRFLKILIGYVSFVLIFPSCLPCSSVVLMFPIHR